MKRWWSESLMTVLMGGFLLVVPMHLTEASAPTSAVARAELNPVTDSGRGVSASQSLSSNRSPAQTAENETEGVPKTVTFFSEGVKLVGDLYVPTDVKPAEKRAGIVICYGYTGTRKLYPPATARALSKVGYVVLTFDYKGWGDSGGPKTRLAPYSRVADAQAALTFLALQPQVEPSRLGIYGSSYGGSTVVWVAAVDPRVKCVVSALGVANGLRWLRSVRRPDEYADLMERSAADRNSRVMTGKSEFVDRNEILLPDRQSAALSEAARQKNPNLVSKIPLEFVDDTAGFNPEWVVDKIAPRPVLFITVDNDRLTTPEQTEAMFTLAGEPKKLVVLKGYGHYEIYTGEAFREESNATISWFEQYLPARTPGSQ